jgi:hypothetical protein
MAGAICEECGEPIDMLDGCRCCWSADEDERSDT